MTDVPSSKPNGLLFIAAAVVSIAIAVTAMVLVLTIHRSDDPDQAVTKFYTATSCDQIHARVTDALWAADYADCSNAAVAASAASFRISVISTSTSGDASTVKAEVTDSGAADNRPPSSAVVAITLLKVNGTWKVSGDNLVPVAH